MDSLLKGLLGSLNKDKLPARCTKHDFLAIH
jgi:hypothetical protein